MSTSRLTNSKRNTAYGLFILVIKTALTFVVRTLFIKKLGVELLSINGLLTEIVGMISLVELGFGMAIVYNLYEPLANSDNEKISSLMTVFRKAYNIVAFVVLALGLILMPLIRFIVADITISNKYLIIIYSLFLAKTFVSYLFAYKSSLLYADQKQYIVSLIGVILQIISSVFGIVIIVLWQNYVAFLIVQIVYALFTNIVISIYVNKKYPQIQYNEPISKEERKKVFRNIGDIFIKRVSGVVTSSTDNILISIIISTLIIGYYGNYMTILGVFRALRAAVTAGLASSIGNMFVTATVDKCSDILKKLTYAYFCLAMFVSAGLLAGFQPFITIWLGKDFLLDRLVVMVIVVNMFFEILFDPIWQYLEVSGLFKEDKKIAILGVVVNLVSSIVLGILIGLSGILIGTLLSQCIQFVLKTVVIHKKKFSISSKRYFLYVLKLVIIFMVLVGSIVLMDKFVVVKNIWAQFFINCGAACGFAMLLCVIPFIKSSEFHYFYNIMKGRHEKIFPPKENLTEKDDNGEGDNNGNNQ